MKVFVSSTYLDLKEHRKEAARAITEEDFECIWMEDFLPSLEKAEQYCPEQVDEADHMILLVGWRYGYVPEDQEGDLSVTHLEYNQALENGMRVLIYLMHENHPRLPSEIDSDRSKINELREHLKLEHTPQYFTDPESLYRRLKIDLPKLPHPPRLAHPYSLQSNFTGRIEERKALSKWLCHDNDHPVISLTAIGGMGKSALSWVWLNLDVLHKKIPGLEKGYIEENKECNILQENQPQGILQWSFYHGELSFSQFLVEACRYTGGEPEPPKGEEKITDNERMRTLVSRFQDHRYLFILDGFERLLQAYARQDAPLLQEKDAEEYSAEERRCSDLLVARFLENISAGGKSKFLITSRLVPKELEGKPGFLNVDLTGLNDEDAVSFLNTNKIIGLDREKKKVANQYKNHPLSLAHLVNVLKKDPDSPNDISQAPSYDISTKVRGRREHILSQSYKILPKEWKRFLTRISAVRGAISYDFIKLVNEGIDEQRVTKDILPNLEEMRWIFWDRKKKLVNLHPLARRFCYLRLEERGEKIRVHEILKEYWENLVEEYDKNKLMKILSQEMSIFEALGTAGQAEIPKELQEILKQIGIGQDIELPEEYGEISEIIKNMQEIAVKSQFKKIGSLDDLQPVIELYHHTVGAGSYDEAVILFRDRIAETLYYQMGVYQVRIELLEALFTDGLDKPPKLSDEAWQAWTLNGLANSYSLSGKPRRAVPLLKRQIAIREKQGVKKSIAIGLGNLAEDQMNIGDLESSEADLRRAISIDREINEKWHEANDHFNLIKLFANIGNFEESWKESEITLRFLSEDDIQQIGTVWAYRSLRALLMAQDPEAEPEWAKEYASATEEECRGLSPDFPQGLLEKGLKCANRALEFAKKTEETIHRYELDFIRAWWLIGASYVAMKNIENAEAPLQFAITECRKINLGELEAPILLELAKLRHLQKRNDESLKLVNEALGIANRCSYVLQQADIYLFLAEFYKDQGDINKAKEHAELAKLRSHQMIDVETVDYIIKPEDTKWKYKPCYDKAVNFLSSF